MTRKLVCIGAGVALLAWGVTLWLSPAHRINEAAAAEITTGMTRPEVERIVRVPPGNYQR
jgi:hypothetical protein